MSGNSCELEVKNAYPKHIIVNDEYITDLFGTIKVKDENWKKRQ